MIFSSPYTARIPEVAVHEAIFFNINEHEHKIALVDGKTDKSFTYKELERAVKSFASALTKRGFKKGDVIAYYAPNSVKLAIGILGCFSIGAIVTGVNFNYTAYELQHQISDCKVKGILTVSENLPKIKEAEKHYKIQTIITLDNKVPHYTYVDDLFKDDGLSYPHGLSFNVYEDVAAILYSSGTTGLPKGVMLTHHTLMGNISLRKARGVAPADKDGEQGVAIGFLPFFHIYGLMLLCLMVACGKKLLIVSGFQPDVFLGLIQKHRVSKLFLVPPVVLFLAKSPLVLKYDVSTVTDVSCGAAPLKQELEKEFLSRFTNANAIRQGYGLTETTGAVVFGFAEKHKYGSTGSLLPNTSGKIIDIADGKALMVGQEGELCVKGPQLMKGYINRPEATRNMIDEEGWLHTGDLGYFDEDGDLFITGRIKELIKYKGFQVAPAEVEGLIMTHPAIDDAAVIGVPDQAAGELPRAFVVRKPESRVTAEDIFSFVKDRLSKHKWLSGGVQFVNRIPKTASGKIVRSKVKEMFSLSKL